MHSLITPEIAKKYEPSSECKERWLYTRKKKLEFDDLELNGFYCTDKFKRDQTLSILGFLSGTLWTLRLMEHTSQPLAFVDSIAS